MTGALIRLATGYLLGAAVASRVARRRRRPRWRVATITVTPVRVGLCRFGEPPRTWDYRADLDLERR